MNGKGLNDESYTNSASKATEYSIMAQEEAAIRSNPAKRTTEILKQVFGQ